MARIYGQPVAAVNPVGFGRIPDMQMAKFAEGRVNGGMITTIDPADIPSGALQDAKNALVRFDKTARRPGSVILTPTKPNSNTIMKLSSIKRQDGVAYTFRFTPTTVHSRQTSSWTAFPFTTTALIGTADDRFETAIVLDEFVFSNNGANVVQQIDFLNGKYKALGNAPAYRYICGFYNRVVGAALRDENEVRIGWSGDGDITEWDPAVNETSGFSSLVDSPADLSDWITNIFAFTNVLVVLREKSVWVGTKQPIPTQPFYFVNSVPGYGCDCSYSAAIVGEGLAWLDRRSRTVYAFAPGGQLEPIGRPIENRIVDNIDDPKTVFGSFDPFSNEYTIYIPAVGGVVNAWTFSFRSKTWTRHEYKHITSADVVDLAEGGVTIDQLGDVPIDDLPGTIDSLSPSSNIVPIKTFGRDDGEIAVEDINANTDAPYSPDFPSGIPYETLVVSKCFTVPEVDMYIAEIVLEYQAVLGGTFTIEYSRNGGATDDSWHTAKTVTPTILGEPRLLKLRKTIRTRRFAWRVITNAGRFEILAYEVHVYPSGKSKK